MTAAYLPKILGARVYDVAIESALDLAPLLSRQVGRPVYLKREDTQPAFSFKLRGAYNKMAALSPGQLAAGVACASAGNHAQGVALAAVALRCHAVIVMPLSTPAVKVQAVRQRGGAQVEVILFGHSYFEAQEHALNLAALRRLSFVHAFDDPDVIAGQGTIGMEILRQHMGGIHAIFVAVGGGGLISGIGAYVKQVRPEIRIIGAQTVDSDAMTRSLQAGDRVLLPRVGLFSDGTAVRQVGQETLRVARQVVDEMITVDHDAICLAIRDVFQDTRGILEPAGALPIAGLKEYARRAPPGVQGGVDASLIAVTGGANLNFEQLCYVTKRAEACGAAA